MSLKKIIQFLTTPSEKVPSIYEIDLFALRNKGKRNLFIDLDNTLVAFTEKNPSLKCVHWINFAKELGFFVCITSNNRKIKRVKKISDALDVYAMYYALKPIVWSIKELMEIFSLRPKDTVVIGDQVLTDIVLGNWLDMHTILVKPISLDYLTIKTAQYKLEKRILKLVSRW